MINEHQHEIIQWAKALVQQEPVILDTETTGLNDAAEICQIAIVNFAGEVLLDQRIKPKLPIPPDATRIHGITNAMVQNAPTWFTVTGMVLNRIDGREVVIYNADYDTRLMHQSTIAHGFDRLNWSDHARFHCAMERYAEYNGDWNDYRGNYRWVKLTDACRQCGIPDPDAPAHSALGDYLRTLALVNYLASQ